MLAIITKSTNYCLNVKNKQPKSENFLLWKMSLSVNFYMNKNSHKVNSL